MTCKTPHIVSTPKLGGCTKKSRILTGIAPKCYHNAQAFAKALIYAASFFA